MRAATLLLGPCPNSACNQSKIVFHADHFTARHLFVLLLQRTTRGQACGDHASVAPPLCCRASSPPLTFGKTEQHKSLSTSPLALCFSLRTRLDSPLPFSPCTRTERSRAMATGPSLRSTIVPPLSMSSHPPEARSSIAGPYYILCAASSVVQPSAACYRWSTGRRAAGRRGWAASGSSRPSHVLLRVRASHGLP
jgi:hypothetical protein